MIECIQNIEINYNESDSIEPILQLMERYSFASFGSMGTNGIRRIQTDMTVDMSTLKVITAKTTVQTLSHGFTNSKYML